MRQKQLLGWVFSTGLAGLLAACGGPQGAAVPQPDEDLSEAVAGVDLYDTFGLEGEAEEVAPQSGIFIPPATSVFVPKSPCVSIYTKGLPPDRVPNDFSDPDRDTIPKAADYVYDCDRLPGGRPFAGYFSIRDASPTWGRAQERRFLDFNFENALGRRVVRSGQVLVKPAYSSRNVWLGEQVYMEFTDRIPALFEGPVVGTQAAYSGIRRYEAVVAGKPNSLGITRSKVTGTVEVVYSDLVAERSGNNAPIPGTTVKEVRKFTATRTSLASDPMIFEPTCANRQKFVDGQERVTVKRNGRVTDAYVVQYQACGKPPVTRRASP